ncbi:MAG: nucleoside/nucleotide kinase family protein [Erysipelotrichaceae bacterium]
MNYKAMINGLEVNATYSQKSIDDLFIPLLKHLIKLQHQKKDRLIVFIAAPPAAGKSTLVHFLEHLASTELDCQEVQSIGIDGFHYYNDYLIKHQLTSEKGSIRTFDIDKLSMYIKRLTRGPVDFPFYDRRIHNPIEDAIRVEKQVILLEGNYLASTQEKWASLRECADYTIFITVNPQEVASRLIHRKMLSGVPLHEATYFYQNSDGKNVDYVLNNRCETDLDIKMENGEYSKNNA